MILRMLTWPIRAPAIWLLGFWTITGWALAALIDVFVVYEPIAVALAVGFTLPAWYLLLGSLSMHGQTLLLHEARGLEEADIEGVTDLNPYTSGMSIRLMLPFLTVMAIEMNLLREDRLVAAGFALAAFAVLWLCVCLEQSLRQGLNPANWFILLRGLHLYFLPVAVLVALPQLVLVHVLFYHHEWWAFALAGYVFIAMHPLIGRLLFYSRKGLNLYTERSPEQDAVRAETELESARRELWNELHILTGSGQLRQAYKKLEAYIDGRYLEQDPIVHERLKELHDQRLMLQHSVHFLQRLLDRKQNQAAWLLLKECVSSDARFRPLSAEAFLQCTQGATRTDAALVNDLLADFDTAYPNSSLSPNAQYRRSRVLRELLNQPSQARQVLRTLSQTHPDFVAQPRVQAYVQSLLE